MKKYYSPMEWVKFERWFEKKVVHDFYIRRRSIEEVTFFANHAILTLYIGGVIQYSDVTTESAQAFIDSENQAGEE